MISDVDFLQLGRQKNLKIQKFSFFRKYRRAARRAEHFGYAIPEAPGKIGGKTRATAGHISLTGLWILQQLSSTIHHAWTPL
jgi:hypothetical protein